jgi:hypothetical protein
MPQFAPNVIRDVTSDATTGAWSATLLAPGKYIALGVDMTNAHNAVVYSHVDAVPM